MVLEDLVTLVGKLMIRIRSNTNVALCRGRLLQLSGSKGILKSPIIMLSQELSEFSIIAVMHSSIGM